MDEYKAGDEVLVKTDTEELQGLFIERPDILDRDVFVLKLKSGYNIGIDKNKIKKVELINKSLAKQTKKLSQAYNKELPTVSILSLGGTISSKVDYRTGGVYADYTAEDFVAMLPELKDVANLKTRKVMNVMSEDMDFEDWAKTAKAVAEELKSGSEGVVLTQGTDTLHYSASALSFFLQDLNKPVILTAAQRSIDRGSSDAFMNLLCAVRAAAEMDIAEVLTCMHASSNDDFCSLVRGTKVRKMHTSRRDAFRPLNSKPVANIYESGKIQIIDRYYRKRNQQEICLRTEYEEKVALIHVFPGMDPGVIHYYLDKGYCGLVLAATALGHVPLNTKNSLEPALKSAREKNVPVVIASQTLYGRVHSFVYTNLRKLSIENDCIFVEDMNPETAYVKLSWLLGQSGDKSPETTKKQMLQNYAGEIEKRSEYNTFLY